MNPPYYPATSTGGDLPYPEVPCGGGIEGRYPSPDEGDGVGVGEEVSAFYVEGNEIRGRKSLMSKLPPGLDKMLDKGGPCLLGGATETADQDVT